MDKISILYLDNHLLAAHKPGGISTQPSPLSQDSLETFCKDWLKKKFNKPGNVFLHAIHRLDKPVSGIVLFARTSKALARLNAAMRGHLFQKNYFALVEGILLPKEGSLEHYLVHGDHIAHISNASHPEAKRAILHYNVIERGQDRSEVEISLVTGRYHQIRAQLGAIGHPVLGDTKYGSSIPPAKSGAIALCHYKLSFPHPITQEMIVIRTDKRALADS